MNMDAWNALPASYQKMVEIACNEANLWLMGAAEATQGEAIAFHESQGVTIHQWPPEFIEAYPPGLGGGRRRRKPPPDPRFKEIYDNYTAFRQNYAKWREIAYLEGISAEPSAGCGTRRRGIVGRVPHAAPMAQARGAVIGERAGRAHRLRAACAGLGAARWTDRRLSHADLLRALVLKGTDIAQVTIKSWVHSQLRVAGREG